MSPVLRGTFWMAMCMLAFAGVAVSVRALSSHLPIIEIVLFRAAFGVAVSLPWLVRSGIGGLRTTRLSLHFARSAVNGVGMFCWFTSLGMMAIGDVLALQFTTPLFLVLLAALTLGETVEIESLEAARVHPMASACARAAARGRWTADRRRERRQAGSAQPHRHPYLPRSERSHPLGRKRWIEASLRGAA